MKILRDNFGRTFPYIRLSITDVCNFKCGYCLPNGYQIDKSDNRKFLHLEEIKRLAKVFSKLGVCKIRLTGGEPTVRKDFFEIINILKETYCGSIGVEFVHIQDADQKQWVQERIEEVRNKTNFTNEGKKAIYKRIVESELFEQFLDKKFLGTKRYGIEGGESMIPGIEQIVKQACLSGIEDIIIGTAHRGRLTLLSSVLEMSYKT